MRIGILGGAFDPIHLGHIDLARRALEALSLGRVLVLPSGQSPYKHLTASRTDRLKMVELACDGIKGLEPCAIEIDRSGETYTADTLIALRERFPEDQLIYIIGSDALERLRQWRGIGEISQIVEFAVIGRPGWTCPEWASSSKDIHIIITDIEGLPLSSGLVRDNAARGLDIASLVGEQVADYIHRHGLYLCKYSEKELLEKLQKTLTVHRYHHTLGVADTAQRLAPRFSIDPQRARLAGLLHDCAKSLPYPEMRRMVEAEVCDTDIQELDAEPVLHAPAGMILARRDYGVKDASILQAIRRHTLGGSDMTPMDALIYVSDYIEPGRKPFPGLEEARTLAESDIYAAMRLCAKQSSEYVISRGQKPHPRTMQCVMCNA